MRITEQEQKQRGNRMLHVAFELFCEFGIVGVSVAQIATKADVSPNSIFRYYNSKADLVKCTQFILWEEIIEPLSSDNAKQLATAKNGLEEIEILLSRFQNLYQNHGNYRFPAIINYF